MYVRLLRWNSLMIAHSFIIMSFDAVRTWLMEVCWRYTNWWLACSAAGLPLALMQSVCLWYIYMDMVHTVCLSVGQHGMYSASSHTVYMVWRPVQTWTIVNILIIVNSILRLIIRCTDHSPLTALEYNCDRCSQLVCMLGALPSHSTLSNTDAATCSCYVLQLACAQCSTVVVRMWFSSYEDSEKYLK